VPAYFTDKQIDATRKAGRLAGLKVQKILDEPTAAAIAFGVDNVGADDSPTVLVYDLGGGTFDVSVMAIVGGSFVALDIEGDMWLGGDDFDRKIMDHVLLHISTIYGVNGSSDPHFMVELKKKAEQAKRALSTMSRTDIIIPGMLKDDEGNMLSVELELSRSEFEGMIAKDVARGMEIVQTAIKECGRDHDPGSDRPGTAGGRFLVHPTGAEVSGRLVWEGKAPDGRRSYEVRSLWGRPFSLKNGTRRLNAKTATSTPARTVSVRFRAAGSCRLALVSVTQWTESRHR
jgi:hypothetical protein